MDVVTSAFVPVERTALAQQIANALQKKIAEGFKPGDPLPSMRELCQQFDVSINTIQTAVATLAREGFVRKRAGSGVYVTERGARKQIGVLSELDLLDPRIGPHFRAVANAVRERLRGSGAEPLLYVGHAEPGRKASDEPTCPAFWTDAATGRLDGAVILDVPSTNAWNVRVRNCPIPAVGAMTPFPVSPDMGGIVNAGVRALAARGCRRLGLLAWHQEERFLAAVAAQGLETDGRWIRAGLDPAERGAGWDEFRDIWSAPEKPDGLLVLDDMLFADAQIAVMELGVRVPRDLQLAVMTSRGASPPIRLPATMLEIDPAELAARYVETVMRLLRGEKPKPGMCRIAWRERAAEARNGEGAKRMREALAEKQEAVEEG